jgi:hypothetical protein
MYECGSVDENNAIFQILSPNLLPAEFFSLSQRLRCPVVVCLCTWKCLRSGCRPSILSCVLAREKARSARRGWKEGLACEEALYFSCLNSLGAAHWVAQCWRWKTVVGIKLAFAFSQQARRVCWPCREREEKPSRREVLARHTFFDAVFLGTLVIGILLLLCDAFHALVEMVFVALALGRASAFYSVVSNAHVLSPRMACIAAFL